VAQHSQLHPERRGVGLQQRVVSSVSIMYKSSDPTITTNSNITIIITMMIFIIILLLSFFTTTTTTPPPPSAPRNSYIHQPDHHNHHHHHHHPHLRGPGPPDLCQRLHLGGELHTRVRDPEGLSEVVTRRPVADTDVATDVSTGVGTNDSEEVGKKEEGTTFKEEEFMVMIPLVVVSVIPADLRPRGEAAV
jgi:hypothetical protein